MDERLPGGELAGAGLEDLAKDDVVDGGRVEAVALDEGADEESGEFARGVFFQGAAELAPRGAGRIVDEGGMAAPA